MAVPALFVVFSLCHANDLSVPGSAKVRHSVTFTGDPDGFSVHIPSPRAGSGPAVLQMGTRSNPVVLFGYNQRPYYLLADEIDHGLAWAIEPNYDGGSGNPKMEAYLQMLGQWGSIGIPATSENTIRPFMTQIDKVTHLPVETTLSGGSSISLRLMDGTGTASEKQIGRVRMRIDPLRVTVPGELNADALSMNRTDDSVDAVAFPLFLRQASTEVTSSGIGSGISFRTQEIGGTRAREYAHLKATGVTFNTGRLTFTTLYGNGNYVDALSVYRGKVSIGTTQAQNALDVAGYVNASQGFKAGGTYPVADGTYAVGNKVTGNGKVGKLTIRGGIITAIQQAQ